MFAPVFAVAAALAAGEIHLMDRFPGLLDLPPDLARPPLRVVLDPGHGGDDRGAVSPQGIQEKDLVLSIARRVAERLARTHRVEVLFTRDSDRFVALRERIQIANQDRADLFVSIHANAARRGRASGVETYFLSAQATDPEARSTAEEENRDGGLPEGWTEDSDLVRMFQDLRQAETMEESRRLAVLLQGRLARAEGAESRGVKQALFAVLVGANMPAALVEVGFLSRPQEAERLSRSGDQEEIADAVAAAILQFGRELDQHPPPP